LKSNNLRMAPNGWMTGTCAAGTADLHYLRTAGAGPPLVLLHGLTANGACWGPVARFLEDEFDVVMPDARGHGQSSTPLQGYRYDDHAGDVTSLIRALGLPAPILLGHSMGGMTAAVAAGQLGGRIRALVLVDPTFLSPQRQREVRDSDVAEQHRRLLSRNRDELAADLRARHPHRSAEMIELLAAARLQARLSAFDVLTPPNPDYRELVGTIGVPVLLVIGDAPVVSLETATELQQLNPRLRVEQIENAGHGLPYDQPERLAALVRSFDHQIRSSGTVKFR
jgi:pimeloyl-ACP methyl ester carboxylesterase